MIRGFEPTHPLPPEGDDHFQWKAALQSGFIAGVVLLLVPYGSPWSALTFFVPVILGRRLPDTSGLPLLLSWVVHLIVSLVYGLVVSRVVAGIGHQRALLAGGVTGLLLYILNLVVISLWWPALRGSETAVVFAHLVFGLIAAGAYRGLLRRRAVSLSSQ